MLYEMNPELLEKNYLESELVRFLAALKRCKSNGRAKAKLIVSEFYVSNESGSQFNLGAVYRISQSGALAPKWGSFSILVTRIFPEVSIYSMKSAKALSAVLQEKRKDISQRSHFDLEKFNAKDIGVNEIDQLLSEYQSSLEALLLRIKKKKTARSTLISDALTKKLN